MSLHEAQQQLVLSSGIMVDVETAGPGPSRYALLSLGACLIDNPDERFYTEFVPDRNEYLPEALATIGYYDLSYFYNNGVIPREALSRFHAWVWRTKIGSPVFVAHNAAFDWMFYADYCVRYMLTNSFGYKPFDTASAYGSIMTIPIPHHAGEDAYLQTLDLRRYYGLTD